MARTPQEVFDHHVQALGAGDLDEIVVDYSDDAILITEKLAPRYAARTESGRHSFRCWPTCPAPTGP